jgi:hypothetical protein
LAFSVIHHWRLGLKLLIIVVDRSSGHLRKGVRVYRIGAVWVIFPTFFGGVEGYHHMVKAGRESQIVLYDINGIQGQGGDTHLMIFQSSLDAATGGTAVLPS